MVFFNMSAVLPKNIKQSLFGAGFKFQGKYFIHYKLGITVPDTLPLSVMVDSLDSVAEFLESECKPEKFGQCLVEWVETKMNEDAEEAPGFIIDADRDGGADTGKLDVQYLQGLVQSNPERELTIYTWGKSIKKHKPDASQRNFNASVLNGRAKGIDLKSTNGLADSIQSVVSRCSTFDDWIIMVVGKIEQDDLHVVSINCSKGRHRSVAAAEILRKVWYPQAQVIHTTIR